LKLFSIAQDCSHYSWIAPAVQNTDDEKWLFWNIGNQVAMDEPEANWTGAEIGPEMAGKWSFHEHVDGGLDIVQYAICSIHVILGYEFPNVVQICKRVWMKPISAHA